jgi:hypothetical protein
VSSSTPGDLECDDASSRTARSMPSGSEPSSASDEGQRIL